MFVQVLLNQKQGYSTTLYLLAMAIMIAKSIKFMLFAIAIARSRKISVIFDTACSYVGQ